MQLMKDFNSDKVVLRVSHQRSGFYLQLIVFIPRYDRHSH